MNGPCISDPLFERACFRGSRPEDSCEFVHELPRLHSSLNIMYYNSISCPTLLYLLFGQGLRRRPASTCTGCSLGNSPRQQALRLVGDFGDFSFCSYSIFHRRDQRFATDVKEMALKSHGKLLRCPRKKTSQCRRVSFTFRLLLLPAAS